jgi:hypothetical protein
MSKPKLTPYWDLQERWVSVLSFITVVGKEKAKMQLRVKSRKHGVCRLKELSSLLLDSWGRCPLLTFQETC